MTPPAPTIHYLADRPRHLPRLAAWQHRQWGHLDPGGTLDARIARLEGQLQRTAIPLALVAVDGDEPLGSASLVEHDLDHRPEWSPWLASVIVAPEHRRRGIGSALVERAMAEARAQGIATLYLFTPDQQRLYARLGWRDLAEEAVAGYRVTVMTVELGG
jgi:predicted N-acetyltransferase YhbS